jgi:hypothetical protein
MALAAPGFTATTPLGFITGNGRSNSASAKLKIAEFAPMPMASEHTATAVNPGFLASILAAYFTSFSTSFSLLFLGSWSCRQGQSQTAEAFSQQFTWVPNNHPFEFGTGK